MPKRCIVLPSGRRVTLGRYVAAWRTLKTLDPAREVDGFAWYPMPAGEVLLQMRTALTDRINRHAPAYGCGRKWDENWQVDTRRAAHQLNTPRRIIRYLPPWLRARFQHRLTGPDD